MTLPKANGPTWPWQEKDVDQDAQLAQKAPVFSGNLRIAYHYNYENNQDKLTVLKNLGFNCIYMYRNGIANSPWQEDITRMTAFLDRLLANGIYAILSIDHFVLESADSAVYSKEQNWISSLESHKAVIGFATYDEPQAAGYSQANQNTLYTRIKAVTNKDVFMTTHIETTTTLINYYTPLAFDVLCLDNYSTYLSAGSLFYDTPDKRKQWLFDSFQFFKNIYWADSPKRVIPVLPLFSLTTGGVQYGLPTKQILQEYFDVCSVFGFNDYGVFAFDVSFNPSLLTDTIDSNVNLQKLCSGIMSGIYQSKQAITTIKPRGFKLNKNYISSTNMDTNTTDFEKLSVIGSSSSDASLVFRVNIDSPSTSLAVSVRMQNKQDVLDRQINLSYSTDGGTTYSAPVSQIYNTGIDSLMTTIFTIPKNIDTILIKLDMINNTHATPSNEIGITLIAAALV